MNEAPEQSGAFSDGKGGEPVAVLRLWPHRSLPRTGFVTFIVLTSGLLALPLIALLGSPVLWGLLPFVVTTVAGVWIALQRSYRDGQVLEELALWPDLMRVSRRAPGQPVQLWEANPHWVRLSCDPSGGPVEHYLTLRGAGHEIELGAFLTPREREALRDELQMHLARLS